MEKEENNDDNIVYNNITINPNSEAVYLNGEQIELTYLEYQILYLLLSNRKRIFQRKHCMRVFGMNLIIIVLITQLWFIFEIFVKNRE